MLALSSALDNQAYGRAAEGGFLVGVRRVRGVRLLPAGRQPHAASRAVATARRSSQSRLRAV
jgi:hypothetical protein